MVLALILAATLFALAGVHLYWAFGGRWPGHDEASLVEHVVGRTRGMRAPGFLASAAVALARAAGGVLVLASLASTAWACGLHAARWGLFAVFAGRGLASYAPPIFRYAEGTPFATLNRRAYAMFALGEAVDGTTAAAWGLANAVVPGDDLRARARTAADQLATRPLGALTTTKRLMRDAEAIAALMDKEGTLFAERLQTAEAREAFMAFAERRAPDFSKVG